jgi:RimJ/RimL family protein N-acetyltransferase
MRILETERLVLRRLTPNDAAFILELLNDPAWLRFIGDKDVRTLEDARAYIRGGPMDMYARLDFGLYLVELKDDGAPIGICGLIKRDALDDVDLGFALLSRFRSRGYAHEAASAVLPYARNSLGLTRIVAIASPNNDDSSRLLEKLGFQFERMIKLTPLGAELKLFAAAI